MTILAAMGAEKYHVLNPQVDARCGASVAPAPPTPARRIEPMFRCQRTPCKAKWPAFLRAVG